MCDERGRRDGMWRGNLPRSVAFLVGALGLVCGCARPMTCGVSVDCFTTTDMSADEAGVGDYRAPRFGVWLASGDWVETALAVEAQYAEYTDERGVHSRYIRIGVPMVGASDREAFGSLGFHVTYVGKDDDEDVVAVGASISMGGLSPNASSRRWATGLGFEIELGFTLAPEFGIWGTGAGRLLLACRF